MVCFEQRNCPTIICGIFGTLPGAVQTVPRAEVYAAVKALEIRRGLVPRERVEFGGKLLNIVRTKQAKNPTLSSPTPDPPAVAGDSNVQNKGPHREFTLT